MTRNIEIDRLRAIAVLATMYAHIRDLWMWPMPLLDEIRLYTNGYDGVFLFFVISGYVISKTLIPKLDNAKNQNRSTVPVLIAFFVKRFYRITPSSLLWVVVLLSTVIIIDPINIHGNISAAIAAALNIFNIHATMKDVLPNSFGIYWSLSLEEQFYIALPVFILFTGRKLRITILIFFFLSYLLLPDRFISTFQLPPILGGVLLFILTEQAKKISLSIKFRYILITVSSMLILMIFILSAFRTHFSSEIYLMLSAAYLSLLVYIASLQKNIILPIPFIEPILTWLGSRSFTLYLSHFTIILIVRHYWINVGPHLGYSYSVENSLLIFFTWAMALIICTEFSYCFFEKPLIEKGRIIANRLETSNEAIKLKKLHVNSNSVS